MCITAITTSKLHYFIHCVLYILIILSLLSHTLWFAYLNDEGDADIRRGGQDACRVSQERD